MNELEKKKKELEALIEQLENKQDIEGIEKMFPGHPELVKFLYEETTYPENLDYFGWSGEDADYYIEREEGRFVLHETYNIPNDIEIYFTNTFDVDELSEYVLNADLQSEVEIKLIHKIKTNPRNIPTIKDQFESMGWEVE